MTLRILERLQQFQEHLFELGVARGILALPAPRMLSLPSLSASAAEPANLFAHLIAEAEIVDVSRDLFVSGHYSLAVQEAFKAIDKFVSEKAGKHGVSGTALMEIVFSPKEPKLFWTDRMSQSQMDEQSGYHRLYAGAMLGIRNPVTHEFNWVEDAELALELITFAQHLLRKAMRAKVAK